MGGKMYDREYIEHWIRTRQQRRLLRHQPDLKFQQSAQHSIEEAASMLQVALLEKQVINGCIQDEINNLKTKLRATFVGC